MLTSLFFTLVTAMVGWVAPADSIGGPSATTVTPPHRIAAPSRVSGSDSIGGPSQQPKTADSIGGPSK